MKKINVINEYLNKIVDFYTQLKGTNNLINFLKQEVQCIDESLDLIDLNYLPLNMEYVSQCRFIQRENVKKDNFLSLSKKLNSNILSYMSKSYSSMSERERVAYCAFLCCFPIEIESGDLQIEIFTDNILECFTNEDAYISILYKYFKDIID